MKQKVLLLEDVDNLGRTGEIVSVKAGFGRNFLIPQRKAVIATSNTIRMQEKLKKERAIQAEKDCKEAEILAKSLEGLTLKITVKVDADANLYGSVTVQDILPLFQKEQIEGIEKKNIQLPKPIKSLGTFPITLKLKEDVPALIHLQVLPEGGAKVITSKKAKKATLEDEEKENLNEFEQQGEEAKEE